MARDQEMIKHPKIQVKPTAAAGSVRDLARVKREMDSSNTSASNIQTTQPSSTQCDILPTLPTGNPQVLQCPFAVQIRRLTQEEIALHTCRVVPTTTMPKKTNPTTKPCIVHLHHLLPRDILDFNTIQARIRTKNVGPHASPAMSTTQPQTTKRLKPHIKPNVTRPKKDVEKPKRAANRTTRTKSNYHHVFTFRRHVLRKHHSKMYLKCRVRRCQMAYVMFNSVRSLTAHHRLHHHQVTYKYSTCNKT